MKGSNQISTPLEARLYDALKRITQYESPEKLRRSSGKRWGLEFEEAIEMAYENIQAEAANAIRGVRRPKLQVRVEVKP